MQFLCGIFLSCLIGNTPPTATGAAIDTYGHYEPAGSPWLVDVSHDKLTLGHGSVSSRVSAGIPLVVHGTLDTTIATAVSPEWESHPGWFVFVQSPQKIWAYDGAKSLLFDRTTPKGGETCQLAGAFDTIPELPPREVMERLPEEMQKALEAKFPTVH